MTLLKIKPWLVLTLIFVLGVATGISLTVGLGSPFMHAPGAQQMKNRMLMGLTHRLNLTPDQQAKIDPILTAAESQIQTIHRDEVGRISHIMEGVKTQILPILTPEQQMELQKMEKEMEKQRDRMFPGHMRPWRQSAPPPPPGGAPPNGPPPQSGPTDAPSGPPPQK
jgi:Spy/CpxP family protein refolding chaperone